MPGSKKQMLRLRRFVGQLKENRYPNCQSFIADLVRSDREMNQCLTCSTKTIQRDIKFLQNELDCPIDFDYRHNGYYLKHHGWNMDMLQLLSENEMLAAVLGARVAENIFPEPLRSDIRNSVDAWLAENNPDFLDKTIVKSLTIIPGLRVSINPKIFMTVFSAWQEHEALDIVYNDLSGRGTRRRVEPHALVYYECSWYFKGFCLLRNEVRNFAIHRITQAVKTGLLFEPDNKIIDRVLNDQFLDYKEVKGIELFCEETIKNHLAGSPLHRKQKLTKTKDGRFKVRIPAMPEHEIIQWTLYQAGNVEIVKPVELREKIRLAAKKIEKNHEA